MECCGTSKVHEYNEYSNINKLKESEMRYHHDQLKNEPEKNIRKGSMVKPPSVDKHSKKLRLSSTKKIKSLLPCPKVGKNSYMLKKSKKTDEYIQ